MDLPTSPNAPIRSSRDIAGSQRPFCSSEVADPVQQRAVGVVEQVLETVEVDRIRGHGFPVPVR
jgi:hypothetical protein